MIYDIVNPSDAYTIAGDEFRVVAAAVITLGQGWYGLRPLEATDQPESHTMPILADDAGATAWAQQRFGVTLPEWFNSVMIDQVAHVLLSIRPGGLEDRAGYEAQLVALTEAERIPQIIRWCEERASSLNTIGVKAVTLGRWMLDRHAKVQNGAIVPGEVAS